MAPPGHRRPDVLCSVQMGRQYRGLFVLMLYKSSTVIEKGFDNSGSFPFLGINASPEQICDSSMPFSLQPSHKNDNQLLQSLPVPVF